MLLLIFSILNHEIPVFGIGAKELWGCIFIHIGHQLRLYYSKYQAYLNTSWYNLGAVVLLAIGCCYWPTSILGHKPACLFPYTISALTTTILVFNLSRRLTASTLEGAKKCLTYIGDHTLQILTWHFLSFKIISYVIIKTYNLQIERLSEYPTIIEYSLQGWWIPYLIIGIATPLLLDRFILSKINLLDRIIKIKT